MPNILFQGKDSYFFDHSAFELQYYDSGDLHGNDNFRAQNKMLTAYEVLYRIEPKLLQSALAVKLNGKPAPLTEIITADCTLDIITAKEPDGKVIYYRSLAFLLAQTAFALNSALQLSDMEISDSQCVLQFIAEDTAADSITSITERISQQLEQHLEQHIADKAAIQLIDAFQKEMLLETYPSLLQPYAQKLLADYDDYDFVPIAARQNFVLPVQENAILVANPELIHDFSISCSISHFKGKNIYTITATQNN